MLTSIGFRLSFQFFVQFILDLLVFFDGFLKGFELLLVFGHFSQKFGLVAFQNLDVFLLML